MDDVSSEPSDIAMSMLKFLWKHCCPKRERLRWTMMHIRVAFSTISNILICALFVHAFIPELDTAVFYAPMAVVECLCLAIETLLLRGVMAGTVQQRPFIIAYKSMDFIFSAVNGGFMLYEREKLVFTHWEQVLAVIITVGDLLDPVEIVLAYSWRLQ